MNTTATNTIRPTTPAMMNTGHWQVVDLLGVRPGGLPRVLRGVLGAAGEGERHQREEAETATTGC